MRCRNGGGRDRPRSRQTSWCRTSPSHGGPSTVVGRVYCPSPPWLVGLHLVTQHSHSREQRVWGVKKIQIKMGDFKAQGEGERIGVGI